MASDVHNYITPADECLQNTTNQITGPFCNATWDTITCWPPTPSGRFAKQLCPYIFGAMPEKYVYKKCESDGTWAISELWKGFGHSDYSECIDHISMLEEVFDIEKETGEHGLVSAAIDTSKGIAAVCILGVSLTSLVASLFCLNYVLPRSVNRAPQYSITRHLFVAIFLEMLVNMVKKCFAIAGVYHNFSSNILTRIPLLCEILISASELVDGITCMWLLIQVHHLQLTANSGRLCTSGYMTYCLVGWGIQIIPTAVWVLTSSLSHKVTCWTGYQSQPIIWILHAPKLAMLTTTLIFLVIAMRRLSSNFEMLNNGCCYRRLFFETIFCTLFFTFVGMLMLANILHGQLSATHGTHESFDILCTVLNSAKGLVASVLFWCFNADARQLLETKVRRISRQELVPASVNENEV